MPKFGIPLGAQTKIVGREQAAGGKGADQGDEVGFLGIDALRPGAEGGALPCLQLVLELSKVCSRRPECYLTIENIIHPTTLIYQWML